MADELGGVLVGVACVWLMYWDGYTGTSMLGVGLATYELTIKAQVKMNVFQSFESRLPQF